MTSARDVTLLLALSLAVFHAPANAEVSVVDDDGGPGVDFQDLFAAISAAADGDIVLVRAGAYTGAATIENKAVTIQADALASVEITIGTLSISHLSTDQAVVLRGLTGLLFQVDAFDNDGTVWIEECNLQFGLNINTSTVFASNSAHVAVMRSAIVGLPMQCVLGEVIPRPAILAIQSSLSIYDSQLTGGLGEGGKFCNDVPAADGMVLQDAFLFSSGSTFTGGDGGSAPGGDGLSATNSTIYLLDTSLVGGAGHPPGEELDVDAGTDVTILPGSARRYFIESPRRYGESIQLTFRAPALDLVFLARATDTTGLFSRSLNGTFLVDPNPMILTLVGTIPDSGELTIQVTVPTLSGLEGLPLFSQALFLTASGGDAYVGTGSIALLLDPAH